MVVGLEVEARDVLGALRARAARHRDRASRAALRGPPPPRCAGARRCVTPAGVGKLGQVILAERDRRGCSAARSPRVLASASGRSAKRSAISACVVKYCSGVKRLGRRVSARTWPSAMHTRASCGAEILARAELDRDASRPPAARARSRARRWPRRARRRPGGPRAALRGSSAAGTTPPTRAPRLRARRSALPCSSAAPTSPSRAPDSAIRPSVPSANHSRRNSARPRCWLVRYARVSHSQSRR